MIGRSSATRKSIFSKPTLTEKLIANAPNLDVHIIPDAGGKNAAYRAKKARRKSKSVFSVSDLLKNVAILILASCIGMLFRQLGVAEANIITVYVLGVLVTSVVTRHRIYSLISSIVSVLVFNFFFTNPQFTSRISCHLFNYVFGGTAHKLACREVKRACETVCKGGLI